HVQKYVPKARVLFHPKSSSTITIFHNEIDASGAHILSFGNLTGKALKKTRVGSGCRRNSSERGHILVEANRQANESKDEVQSRPENVPPDPIQTWKTGGVRVLAFLSCHIVFSAINFTHV
ncbi:MAG: hypothetical protein V1262_03575, partial [Alphaproteobacteria bacterium]|nr:hypothetical protein [Alphaproteobacteria bacterium]